jgi:hypothetical protein
MQLYTVRMVARKIITMFGTDGNKTGEREELVPQVYHDLPLSTAQRYERLFPDNQVTIVEQAADFVPERKERVFTPGESRHTRRPTPRSKVPQPAPANNYSAAQSGDMAAAINAELES